MHLSLVIPTLNEAGNIGEACRRAHAVMARLEIEHELLIADGGSTDGTCEEAEAAGAVVIRQAGTSYGDALRHGFERARGDYIASMDSDLSHEPEFLEQLWRAREHADIVIASRYAPGGRADMSTSRAILSRILNIVYTTILQVPVRDISSGFRLYRRSAIESIEFTARDFDVLEEILIKLYVRGHGVAEVPFHYRPRKEGRSHAKLFRFALAYLRTLLAMMRLRWSRPRGRLD